MEMWETRVTLSVDKTDNQGRSCENDARPSLWYCRRVRARVGEGIASANWHQHLRALSRSGVASPAVVSRDLQNSLGHVRDGGVCVYMFALCAP